MKKTILLLSFIMVIFSLNNCTKYIKHKRYGPGKARFNMIAFDNNEYLLSIKDDNTYSLKKNVLRFVLTITNKNSRPTIFKLKNKNLLAFYMRNSQSGKILQKEIILSNDFKFINKDKFFIGANKSIEIPFQIKINKSIIETNKNLYCRLKMLFVHKLYRRNMLSIHLEKE